MIETKEVMRRYFSTPIFHAGISESERARLEGWRLALPIKIPASQEASCPKIIAVGGGKGGVGKTMLSSNLAAGLALRGYRTLAVDLDLGCSNLHSHFGLSMPKKSLVDFLLNRQASFADVLQATPIQGLTFIAGGNNQGWSDRLERGHSDLLIPLWQEILGAKSNYNFDFVVIDLGAGTHSHTIDFFLGAHLGIVTVLPEPASIENAYVFLKMVLWKMVENIGRNNQKPDTAREIKRSIGDNGQSGAASGYLTLLTKLEGVYPEFIRDMRLAMHCRKIGVVINQAREQADRDIGLSMEHICRRYFGFNTHDIGYLNYDETVWKSTKIHRLPVLEFPHSQVSKRISFMVSKTLDLLSEKGLNHESYAKAR